ncbi:MAG: helix-turn-helix transcriptional regulator [Rikenellaceae bacterium]
MKSEIDIYIANRVRKIRREKRVSQAMLSFGIGVTKGFLGQVESPNSPSKYNINHLYEIAKFLECSMRDFFPE